MHSDSKQENRIGHKVDFCRSTVRQETAGMPNAGGDGGEGVTPSCMGSKYSLTSLAEFKGLQSITVSLFKLRKRRLPSIAEAGWSGMGECGPLKVLGYLGLCLCFQNLIRASVFGKDHLGCLESKTEAVLFVSFGRKDKPAVSHQCSGLMSGYHHIVYLHIKSSFIVQ